MSRVKTAPRLRVASYNIRKTRGLDQKYDPHRIITVINRLDADVIALQEADHRLGDRPAALVRDLIETNTDFEVAPVAKTDGSIGWHGNALLVRKELEVLSVEHLDLPGLEPRGAVRVDVDVAGSVSVVATHLGLMRRHRRRQLDVIAGSVKGVDRAIVLGDFNEWSPTRGLEPLAERFDIHAPGRTYHAARPVAALDRIAVAKPANLRDAGVDDSPASRRASDHLPVWADVCWSA